MISTWFLNGLLHRADGPAVIFGGGKTWYLNGKRHRENGPAVEMESGHKEWFINGELHRTDGPAIEWADGRKDWYLNGKQLTESEFNARNCCLPKEINVDGVTYVKKIV